MSGRRVGCSSLDKAIQTGRYCAADDVTRDVVVSSTGSMPAVFDDAAATDSNGGANMPFGGPDWLALTTEPTLEPELPICDPHHHFWDFRTERIP